MASFDNVTIEKANQEWQRTYGSRSDGYDLKNVLYASYHSQQTVGTVIRGNVGFTYLYNEIPTWLMIYGDTYIAPEDPTINDKPGIFVSTIKPALTGIISAEAKSYGVNIDDLLSQGSGSSGTVSGTVSVTNTSASAPAKDNSGLVVLGILAYLFA